MPNIYVVNAKDNVATALSDLAAGPAECIGAASGGSVTSLQPVQNGHKIALRDIAAGDIIVKYGAAIGQAIQNIRAGEWVHVHNMRSRFDERSSQIDPNTGIAMDTRYE